MSTDASLALQTGVRAALIADPDLHGLVGFNVRDGRLDTFPGVQIGAGQTVLVTNRFSKRLVRVYLDLHIWVKASDFEVCKLVAGHVRRILEDRPAIDSWHVVDIMVPTTRFLRDPVGEFAHSVVTVEALMGDTQ